MKIMRMGGDGGGGADAGHAGVDDDEREDVVGFGDTLSPAVAALTTAGRESVALNTTEWDELNALLDAFDN